VFPPDLPVPGRKFRPKRIHRMMEYWSGGVLERRWTDAVVISNFGIRKGGVLKKTIAVGAASSRDYVTKRIILPHLKVLLQSM